MWADGYSASRISEEIPGSTKNSIIGKVHRLHLPERKKRKNPSHFKREKVRAMVMVKPKPKPAPKPRPKDGIPFLEADSTTCRSVQGRDPNGILVWFCPKPKAANQSFCPHHLGIYYTGSRR
jgi:hypothetical protein